MADTSVSYFGLLLKAESMTFFENT